MKLFILSALFAIGGQIADCISTYHALARGAHEANPIVKSFLSFPFLFYSIKIGVILVWAVYLYRHYGVKRYSSYSLLIVATLGFGVAIWNML